jgi:hypothetical protein
LFGLEQTKTTLEHCPLHSEAEALFSSLSSMIAYVESHGAISNGLKIEVSLAKGILADAGK